MNKNFLIILLIIVSLVSFSYGFYQHQQALEAQKQIEMAEKQAKMAKEQAMIANQQAEMAKKAQQIAELERMKAVEELRKLNK